jgi:hypothetical protein
VKVPIRASLVLDTASVVPMSYLGLVVRVVVSRLLVQNWVAPTVNGAWLEEVLASFEFDGELLFRSFFLILVAVGIGVGVGESRGSHGGSGTFVHWTFLLTTARALLLIDDTLLTIVGHRLLMVLHSILLTWMM